MRAQQHGGERNYFIKGNKYIFIENSISDLPLHLYPRKSRDFFSSFFRSKTSLKKKTKCFVKKKIIETWSVESKTKKNIYIFRTENILWWFVSKQKKKRDKNQNLNLNVNPKSKQEMHGMRLDTFKKSTEWIVKSRGTNKT